MSAIYEEHKDEDGFLYVRSALSHSPASFLPSAPSLPFPITNQFPLPFFHLLNRSPTRERTSSDPDLWRNSPKPLPPPSQLLPSLPSPVSSCFVPHFRFALRTYPSRSIHTHNTTQHNLLFAFLSRFRFMTFLFLSLLSFFFLLHRWVFGSSSGSVEEENQRVHPRFGEESGIPQSRGEGRD